ncbi:hypothetical protein [Paenibacillus sp. GCM10012306]|uniref:hypothetical protein n=1 Tax=Paenibacillus sp. GCM10012306 TaxID=3317342 RepID=UPI00361C0481
MIKSAYIIALLILCGSMSMLAGCDKREAIGTSTETTRPTVSETAKPQVTPSASAVHSLDEIKWNEIKDPLIQDDMLTTLKTAISALVSNDVDQFHAALAPNIGTAHDYLLNYPVRFTGIYKAMDENNRVLIPVVGERLKIEEGFSPDVQYTFYFEKGKDGIWRIITID